MKRGQSGLNLLLAVDKPEGMTSHDVVSRLRRALGEGRIGHAGTLDPAASGLLVVGVGQGTRLMGMLTQDEKSYEARIAFGAETDTDDAEGETVREADVPSELSDPAFAQRSLDALLGFQDQVPPAYSAISINGQRAYALAREGKDVELPSRRVEIKAAQLLAVRTIDGVLCWDCAFTVSKGTYIRSLARDLGRAAGSAAHLTALRRLASGRMTVGKAISLDEAASAGSSHIMDYALDPAFALGLPVVEIAPSELEALLQGKPRPASIAGLADGDRVTMVCAGKVYGVWECRRRTLRTVANFPQGIAGVHGA